MNALEKIYNQIKEKGNIVVTSHRCANIFEEGVANFRVFICVSIDCLTSYNPYNNESLVLTLKVQRYGVVENWIEMKKSSIKDGGFGVFALRDFSPDELITVYLGEKVNYTYHFKDIVGLHKISCDNSFQEEYWFGHRLNHCSDKRKNVEMRSNYLLCASTKIKAGDELFCDYNRDCFCKVCKNDRHLSMQDFPTIAKCINCQGKKRCFKMCDCCHHFMCSKCYDNFQIKS